MDVTISESCEVYHPPWCERLRVAWQNWRVRKTGQAWRHLEKSIREDEGYKITIQANICMAIYDATRPKCYCDGGLPLKGGEHKHGCQVQQDNTVPRRFELRDMSIEQAAYITDCVMALLFQSSKR